MPLTKIDRIDSHTQLALWKMDESEGQLLSRYPYMASPLAGIKSETRRRERLTACALLEALTGNGQPQIGHDKSGKPCHGGLINHCRGRAFKSSEFFFYNGKSRNARHIQKRKYQKTEDRIARKISNS